MKVLTKLRDAARAVFFAFFLYPLLGLAIGILIILLCKNLFTNPAENMSVPVFMKYHSPEEVIEYWKEYDDLRYISDLIQEASYDEYYFLTTDDVQWFLDEGYARGYDAGLCDELGLAGADLDTISDLTNGMLEARDFLE